MSKEPERLLKNVMKHMVLSPKVQVHFGKTLEMGFYLLYFFGKKVYLTRPKTFLHINFVQDYKKNPTKTFFIHSGPQQTILAQV